jgi:hypothetical protein
MIRLAEFIVLLAGVFVLVYLHHVGRRSVAVRVFSNHGRPARTIKVPASFERLAFVIAMIPTVDFLIRAMPAAPTIDARPTLSIGVLGALCTFIYYVTVFSRHKIDRLDLIASDGVLVLSEERTKAAISRAILMTFLGAVQVIGTVALLLAYWRW